MGGRLRTERLTRKGVVETGVKSVSDQGVSEYGLGYGPKL